jgi:hypothetical protein
MQAGLRSQADGHRVTHGDHRAVGKVNTDNNIFHIRQILILQYILMKGKSCYLDSEE